MAVQPTTYEEAKAMVAGDLGLEMEKFPLRFATAAYFGTPPRLGKEMEVNSGSASLLRLGGTHMALTCHHVLEGYRDRLKADASTIFQLGDCKLDPVKQLKAESEKLDFALVELHEGQAQEIAEGKGDFGTYFIEPDPWPPQPVVEGDFVAFGGFPGELRRAVSFNEMSFGSYSSGASRVTLVRDEYIVCQFEREHWVQRKFEPEPATIRGMSGGPAFALRKSAATGIITYEFVGHVYEFSEDFELLYIRMAKVLGD